MDAGYFNEITDWAALEGLSAAHYHAAAARARRLQAEATTPRLKLYLREFVARCEGLAGKIGSGSEKDRRTPSSP
jgi:hypothetical protein